MEASIFLCKTFDQSFLKEMKFLIFEYYDKKYEIKLFGIGVCREGHADSNKPNQSPLASKLKEEIYLGTF